MINDEMQFLPKVRPAFLTPVWNLVLESALIEMLCICT